MARLPSERYVIQQSGGIVELTEDFTERRIVRFIPASGHSVADALEEIRDSELGDEDKCFAYFWAGYFHAHSDRDPELGCELFITETSDGMVDVSWAGHEIVRFSPADANAAAQAQKAIYDSPDLTTEQKSRTHFWSGFFYAHAKIVSGT